MKKTWRRTLGIVLLLATVVAFAAYVVKHPELLRQLGQTPPWVVAVLLLLDIAWFVTVIVTVQATLRLCRAPLASAELALLTSYSTLVNFFVPGQGGLVVRGLYMKQRYRLGLGRYLAASLVYYASYAIISVFMLLVASRPWWQTCLGLASTGLVSFTVIKWYQRRSEPGAATLDLGARNLAWLLLATAAQACAQAAVYGFELHWVDPGVRLWQVITYTGAANFSLFVALTPGAIGIRESFLYFSQQLHHVDTAAIVAAGVIDRVVFLILLGLLSVATFAVHAKRMLNIDGRR